jgi:hypothetical protein
MKMGRRLRCSSVTYRFRYVPSSRPAAAGPTAYFDRNESHAIYGTGHWASQTQPRGRGAKVCPALRARRVTPLGPRRAEVFALPLAHSPFRSFAPPYRSS